MAATPFMDRHPMEQFAELWSQCLEVAALTDVGLRRANNQDSYKVALAGSQENFDQRGHLFVVADGMGAHAAGELASKIATDVISLDYSKLKDQSPPEAIVSAVLDANRQVHARGQASFDFRGMGTTATMLLLLPSGALAAQVGDSRTYRFRGNCIEQLTFDHSLVWELRATGQVPEGDDASYVPKNIITRSIGPNSSVQVDLEGPFPLEPGDTFLLCSDGLSGPVKDDELGTALACLPPAEAVRVLVDLACVRGGPDNITVIVARVLGPQVANATGAAHASQTSNFSIKPVHPLVWTLMGAATLATAGLFAMGQFVAAGVLLAVAAATAVVALVQRYGGDRALPPDTRRFGRGPYVTTENPVNPEVLSRLDDIVHQLRKAAESQKWSVNWADFDKLLLQAKAADEAGDMPAIARARLRAISSLMSQLRQQENAADSGIFI
jgi:protein phosphatase